MIKQISNGSQSVPVALGLKTKNIQTPVVKPVLSKGTLSKISNNDTVSFGAINPAAKLANSESLAKVITKAREVVGKKGKEATKLVTTALQDVMADNLAGESVKKLAQKDATIVSFLQSVASEAKDAVKGSKAEELTSKAMGVINSAISDYSAVEGGKFLKSKGLHKFLELANTNQAVFDSLFALGLAGVLRPATIYALPAKNKDDNAYAAGHSISSGLIGFGMSLLINAPVAKAMKNVKENASKYLKSDTIDKMGKVVGGQLTGKNVDIATRYVNMIPKLAFAVPQACLTVALVPPLLKNVFGIEKGKTKAKDQVSGKVEVQAKTQVQSKEQSNEGKKISFGGANVNAKKIGLVQNLLSKAVAAVMNNKFAQKVVEKTAKSDINIVKHLTALSGVLISGMYVVRTLKNDKLDSERKSTLAINQAAVSVVSTVLGYTFDKVANTKIEKFIEKFQAANLSKGAEKLSEYAGGIKAAASMMIFGTVYRYLSPVLVTPIANKIGSIVNEQRAAKAEKADD